MTTHSIDPRTKEALWEVPVAEEPELDDAVQAAAAAFIHWKVLSAEERQRILLKLADELERRKHEVLPILAKETGKSVRISDQFQFDIQTSKT